MTGGKENQTGGIEITVYSMKYLPDGDATIADPVNKEIPDFYDICVRDANSDWIDGVDDLGTREEAEATLARMVEQYPDASVEWVW